MKARIRELLRTVPFRPFIIHMADGREYRVDHPDFVLASSSNQSLVVVEDPENERVHTLFALLIASVEEIVDANLPA